MARRDLPTTLVYARSIPFIGWFAYYLLKILGIEIPRSVAIGEDFTLVHGGYGVVIHRDSVIGDRVKIYTGVVLGRADIHLSADVSKFKKIIIENDVILAAGSKVLGKVGEMRVAERTVLGANAVLLESSSPGGVWAGIPARRIGDRDRTQNARAPMTNSR